MITEGWLGAVSVCIRTHHGGAFATARTCSFILSGNLSCGRSEITYFTSAYRVECVQHTGGSARLSFCLVVVAHITFRSMTIMTNNCSTALTTPLLGHSIGLMNMFGSDERFERTYVAVCNHHSSAHRFANSYFAAWCLYGALKPICAVMLELTRLANPVPVEQSTTLLFDKFDPRTFGMKDPPCVVWRPNNVGERHRLPGPHHPSSRNGLHDWRNRRACCILVDLICPHVLSNIHLFVRCGVQMHLFANQVHHSNGKRPWHSRCGHNRPHRCAFAPAQDDESSNSKQAQDESRPRDPNGGRRPLSWL